MKQSLILVDIQNDYFKGGKFELENTVNTVENINKVITHFRQNSYPIIHIHHTALNENAPFFVKDTKGVEFYSGIKQLKEDYVVEKNYPNSFFKTNLKNILEEEKIENIVICGMMTHMCIDSTVRGGCELGYNCTVIEDCCTTRNLLFNNNIVNYKDVQYAFMFALSSFAKVITTNTFLS